MSMSSPVGSSRWKKCQQLAPVPSECWLKIDVRNRHDTRQTVIISATLFDITVSYYYRANENFSSTIYVYYLRNRVISSIELLVPDNVYSDSPYIIAQRSWDKSLFKRNFRITKPFWILILNWCIYYDSIVNFIQWNGFYVFSMRFLYICVTLFVNERKKRCRTSRSWPRIMKNLHRIMKTWIIKKKTKRTTRDSVSSAL